MSAPAIQRMTIDEFPAWENEQERNYELVDGVPVMMTGGILVQDMVRGAISALFRARLRQKPCRAAPSCETGLSDRKRALSRCHDRLWTLSRQGSCRAEANYRRRSSFASTRATDFLVKSLDYESVQSISSYAICWQDEAKAVLDRRQGGRMTVAEQFGGLDGIVEFPDVEVSIAMADIYEGVFDEAE